MSEPLVHSVDVRRLVVPKDRQRQEFKAEDIVKLANSISQVGLIQPVVVRTESNGDAVLVAGERRVRALQYVWNFGQKVKCGALVYDEYQIPCIYQGEMDPVDAFQMELEENIKRNDLTWQERSAACGKLRELLTERAIANNEAPPSTADIALEIRGGEEGRVFDETRKELIVSKYLDDPDIARAKTADDAFKILKRKEEARKNSELSESVGLTFTADLHQLHCGDCVDILPTLAGESVDVILTDPPYGINADAYGDSGGRTGGSHFYDDSIETWRKLMNILLSESFRIAKNQAHLYIFCDIDNFVALKAYASMAGWRVFRTPIIWHNPTAMRAPWPEHGPQRKYQLCLYAVKGDRRVAKLAPDLITYTSDDNLGHQAQKPVDLYSDLLRRSARAGDTVLDAFCGTGPIFPAAHGLRCKAIGIEMNPAAHGIAIQRIQALKEPV